MFIALCNSSDNIANVSSTPQPGSGSSNSVIKIGVIGATNSGKSTTINALLRGKFLPISSGGTTAHVLCIKHDPSKPRGSSMIWRGVLSLLLLEKDLFVQS